MVISLENSILGKEGPFEDAGGQVYVQLILNEVDEEFRVFVGWGGDLREGLAEDIFQAEGV